ncbi:S1C family serine protease [Salirhabdus sp. Marseille-P4669]|uniref:S1C family serine protease n=1 Tax=Salirhabdus sp. Marseille-P4669 TaxID=2042310 RepID=UPI000C7CB5F7|nr:trypsin-like peptidase domain-containing protein [Salirhabdus sp. Marseille-P4669]
MKKHIIWPILITIVIAIVSITVLIISYNNWSKEEVKVQNELATLVKAESEESEKDLKTIIHESQKTVVQIEAESGNGQSIGSGFIYNDLGDIMTNAHVVQNADSIYVKTSDAKTYPAALIGISEEQDIAVIRVPQLTNRTTLEVDPDLEVDIGDEILAVGSPLGFQNTVTTGIISGKNRTFTVEGGFEYKDAYQISAPITNGNSGGPLIHLKTGKIIAVNSAGTKEGSMGFSIPIGKVLDMAKMWSDKTDNSNLNFDGTTNTTDDLTEEQLIENANYIVRYFYENLNIRDYFNAYTLLGSSLQGQTSYQDFRSQYVHVVNFTLNNTKSEMLNQDQVKITLQTDNHTRNSEQDQIIEHYQVSYIIGYENDQVKILEKSQELLSTTNIEPPTKE